MIGGILVQIKVHGKESGHQQPENPAAGMLRKDQTQAGQNDVDVRQR
jgi:hypothetical protein